jgi:hypothetical protein
MVWALVALLVRGPAAVLGYKRAALIGLLLGVASLYKQVIVPAAVLLAGVHLLVPAQGSRESWRRRAGQVAVMAGVGIVLWAAVLAVFGAGARFPSFYEAMVTANRERAGSLAANLAAAFTPRRLALPAAGAGLLIAAGLVWRRGLLARTWALLGAWWLGTFVAVALPGMFYPHYFQLWLPLLAAATGLFVTGLGRLAIARPQRVSILAGTVLLATLLAAELPTYFLSPQQWSIRKYKHDLFVQSQQAARQLTGLLAPQDGLYDWGAESGLYFDTGRRPPSGIFFSLPLESPSIAAAAEHRLLVDLQAHPPELVILRRDHLDYYLSGAISVTRWLVERYDPLALPGFPPKFCVFARRGGPLQERMVAVPKPSPPNSPIAFQGRSAG